MISFSPHDHICDCYIREMKDKNARKTFNIAVTWKKRMAKWFHCTLFDKGFYFINYIPTLLFSVWWIGNSGWICSSTCGTVSIVGDLDISSLNLSLSHVSFTKFVFSIPDILVTEDLNHHNVLCIIQQSHYCSVYTYDAILFIVLLQYNFQEYKCSVQLICK